MSIVEKLHNSYDLLTKNEKKIAEYVCDHTEEVSDMTIMELADRLNISTASISRLAKHLGYVDYHHMKTMFAVDSIIKAEKTIEEDPDLNWNSPIEDIAHSFIPTISCSLEELLSINSIQNIEAAAQILNKCDHVFIYGLGSSKFACENLHLNLLRLHKTSFALQDMTFGLQNLSFASKNDCLVLISYSGKSNSIIQTLNVAVEKGLKVILITSYSKKSIVSMADIVLYCPALQDNDAKIYSLLIKYTQMLLSDILFIAYAKMASKRPELDIDSYIKNYFFIEHKNKQQ